MSRRQLPLVAAPPAAGVSTFAAAEPSSLSVDGRCFALVCSRGLDAAADWLTGLLQGFAHADVVPPLVYVGRTLPVSAAGRACLSSASVFAPGVAFVQPTALFWLLVCDAETVPLGARTLVVLVDRLPARTPDVYAHAAAVLSADRPASAVLLARSVAAIARPTM